MTELSFLLDLLMNHKLQKATKELIAQRIKEVESNLNSRPIGVTHSIPQNIVQQSPSTLALMAKHGDLPPVQMPVMPPIPQVEPQVPMVAQTALANAALESRRQAIAQALSGKIPKGQERPKKW